MKIKTLHYTAHLLYIISFTIITNLSRKQLLGWALENLEF